MTDYKLFLFIGNKGFTYKVRLGNFQAKLRPRCEAWSKDSAQCKHPAQAWIQEKTKNKKRMKNKKPKIQFNEDEVNLQGKKLLKSSNGTCKKINKSQRLKQGIPWMCGKLLCTPGIP